MQWGTNLLSWGEGTKVYIYTHIGAMAHQFIEALGGWGGSKVHICTHIGAMSIVFLMEITATTQLVQNLVKCTLILIFG